jgi:hypothetical protein
MDQTVTAGTHEEHQKGYENKAADDISASSILNWSIFQLVHW